MTKRRRSKKTGRFIRSRHRATTKRKSHRRVWRKSLHRTESWKGRKGKLRVIRNSKGRFVSWRKVRPYTRGKTAKQKWRTAPARRAWAGRAGRRGKISGGNRVSAYGTAHGESRRVQMSGSGQSLYRAMGLVVNHPPKKQFLTVDAEALIDDPEKYLEMKYRWSRPRIES